MKESAIQMLRCPACRAQRNFKVEATVSDGREIREGNVTCNDCGQDFGIHAGVVDLMPPGKMRSEVVDELDGWIKAYEGWFDLTGTKSNFWLLEPENKETEGISSDDFLRRLPYFDKIGPTFQQKHGYYTWNYEEAMKIAGLKAGERVLELGAARCWATRDFARLGCQCAALDIVTTKYLGLESSDVYFQDEPRLYWERIRGDMEELPLADASFDVIYCSSVLHHSKELGTVARELKRILAPGGRVIILNEPDYGWLDKKKMAAMMQDDSSDGVNENLYCCRDFEREFRNAGFDTRFQPVNWLVNYLADQAYRSTFGRLRINSRLLQRAVGKIFRMNTGLIHRFIALGTMGVAKRRD